MVEMPDMLGGIKATAGGYSGGVNPDTGGVHYPTRGRQAWEPEIQMDPARAEAIKKFIMGGDPSGEFKFTPTPGWSAPDPETGQQFYTAPTGMEQTDDFGASAFKPKPTRIGVTPGAKSRI